MKYGNGNIPYICMQTQSTCYKSTRVQTPVGILWHSTGANNPNLKRYVQPSDDSPKKEQDLDKLGLNPNHNDWNHISRNAGLNAWIGKFADGSVGTVQTMPWDYRPWGCGSGSIGSCNNGWIQFEICEDNLTDPVYFEKVYKEACELTAYLCKLYNLDPNGYVMVKGVRIPVITCHNDAAKIGFAGMHSDINHWFPRYGKNMTTARGDVAAIIAGAGPVPTPTPTPTTGNPYKEPTVVVKKGTKGEDAKWVQWELREAGFDKSFSYNGKTYGAVVIDGEIGPIGDAAIRCYQTVMKLEVDGMVGPASRASMKENTTNIINGPVVSTVAQTTPIVESKPVENNTTPTPVVEEPKVNPYKTPTITVKKGCKNAEAVKWVQWELVEAGYGKRFQYNSKKYSAVVVDGVAGDITDAAIRAFQKRSKLTIDGMAGKKTRDALKANHSSVE